MLLKNLANRALEPLGLKLIPAHHDRLIYQHDYGTGGYDAYRDIQIAANKRKIQRVWADERTLEMIAKDIERRNLKTGICHGARNGYEVEWFRERLESEVVGTDISDTADSIPHMIVQDFHEPRREWLGKWDFVYTNSLDQAFDPKKAISTWVDQLTDRGCIYIEHTSNHSARAATQTDPFGAHPLIMPYLLFEWGRGKYKLSEILELEDVSHKGHVWVFVVSRTSLEH